MYVYVHAPNQAFVLLFTVVHAGVPEAYKIVQPIFKDTATDLKIKTVQEIVAKMAT